MAGLLVDIAEKLLSPPEVQHLLHTSQQIGRYVEFAELQQVENDVAENWPADLKNLQYNIIDLFDEWRIADMKFSLSPLDTMGRNKMSHNMDGKIRNLFEEMKKVKVKVKAEAIPLQLRPRPIEKEEVATRRGGETTTIYGRDVFRRKLIRKMLQCKQRNVSYLALTGKSGIGKTALARSVYNCYRVKRNFVVRAWIRVSRELDPIRIVKDILERVTGVSYPMNGDESEVLRLYFRRTVSGRRYLVVLDDVQMNGDHSSDPKNFCSYFSGTGLPGSVILITTRDQIAFSSRLLDPLSEEDSLKMFRHLTFNPKIQIAPSFKELGEQIARMCHGVPLALRAVGALLRNKTSMEAWEQALKRLKAGEFDVTSTWMSTYRSLPPRLRQCLLLASIFPKNCQIDVDKLIKLWMAHDYLRSETGDMESRGEDCFYELSRHSLFQELTRDHKGIRLCTMNDFVTDFIKQLAKNECSVKHFDKNSEDQSKFSFREGRHWTLSIADQASLPKSVRDAARVHTLIIMPGHSMIDRKTLSKLFRDFKRLRALDLSDCSMAKLTSKVGRLLHLRYLNLSFNRDLKRLPEALCDLSLLQTLNLNGCDSLQELPKQIGKLIHLRHLEILWTRCLSHLPKGIRSLTSLRTLNRFIVSSDFSSKPCNLGDLEKLNNLRGSISIEGLKGSTDVALAKRANLGAKNDIWSIRLWFSDPGYGSENFAVLGALQPPPDLSSLEPFSYRGKSFSRWITPTSQLRHLVLSDHSGCETLPPLGKLPFLQSLEIRNMIDLKSIGSEFLGLESYSGSGHEIEYDACDNGNYYEEESSYSEGEMSFYIDGGESPPRGSTSHYVGNRNLRSMLDDVVEPESQDRGEHLDLTSDNSNVGEPTGQDAGEQTGQEGSEPTGQDDLMSDLSDFGEPTGHDGGEQIAFPTLKILKFCDLTKWKKWDEIKDSEEQRIMPNLHSLSIVNCSKISALPSYISRKILKRQIKGCPLLLNQNEENTALSLILITGTQSV